LVPFGEPKSSIKFLINLQITNIIVTKTIGFIKTIKTTIPTPEDLSFSLSLLNSRQNSY